MLAEPAPIEKVKRINAEIVHLNQQTGFTSYNLYTMDIDKERNCYNCGGFGHLA